MPGDIRYLFAGPVEGCTHIRPSSLPDENNSILNQENASGIEYVGLGIG